MSAIDALNTELAEKNAALDTIEQRCAAEQRDVNDAEKAEYDALLIRTKEIKSRVAEINERHQAVNEVASVAATFTPSAPARTNPRPELSKGDELMIRALTDEKFGTVRRALGRDAERYDEMLTRALQHGVVADGTSPTTIEGDLIKFVDASRPAVGAVRRLPVPDNRAKTFERPILTQNAQVGVQAAEGDVLASRRVNITTDTVTKVTFGGTYALSEQATDWTDPSLLQAYVEDIAQQYAIETDNYLADAIVAAGTHATPNYLSSYTLANFVASVGNAAESIYVNSKAMPDVLFVAPDRYFDIAALTAGDGRPAFPAINPTNTNGTSTSGLTGFGGLSVMGLRVVVDPNFASGTAVLAASRYIEFYEQNKGFLQVESPSTLETVYAYRGYVAVNAYSEAVEALQA